MARPKPNFLTFLNSRHVVDNFMSVYVTFSSSNCPSFYNFYFIVSVLKLLFLFYSFPRFFVFYFKTLSRTDMLMQSISFDATSTNHGCFPGPTAKIIKARRRADAERLRVMSACDHCKRIKQKCDSVRPCSRCKRIGNDCEPSEKDYLNLFNVERPIDFSVCHIDVSSKDPYSLMTRAAKSKHAWSHGVIMKYSISGYSSENFVKIFNSLPEPLSTMMAALFTSAQMRGGTEFPTPSNAPVNESKITLDHASAHFASDASLWDSEQVYGFFEVWFDTVARTRQHVFMNNRFAQIHGFHKEELFARFANYDAEFQRTEIDSLLLVLDGLRHILDDSKHTAVERYYRLFSGPSRQPLLVWALWGKGFVQQGRYFKVYLG